MAEQVQDQRFSGLALLPTAMLEKIIQEDFQESSDLDSELIDHVLSLLAERQRNEHPDSVPDTEAGWKDFQDRLHQDKPEIIEIHRKPPIGRRILRTAAIAAICTAIIFAGLITAQALGVNVFHAIAKWTDETFHFEAPAPTMREIDKAFFDELEQAGVQTGCVPKTIPKDYQLSWMQTFDTDFAVETFASFVTEDQRELLVSVRKDIRGDSNDVTMFEKDSGEPECFIIGGYTFYMFRNVDNLVATSSDGTYTTTIDGNISRSDLLNMLQSIKE